MQTLRSILKIGNAGAVLCDPYGATSGITLEMMLGTGCVLEFELRREVSGESAVLPDYDPAPLNAASLYCAFDFSRANRETPALLIFSGISLSGDQNGHTVLRVPVENSATAEISTALQGQESAELICELGGFDGEGAPVFAWQFPVTIHSRVYLGNGSESAVPDPAYYTAVQVEAIAAGLRSRIENASVASAIAVADGGEYFDGTTVEAVLQEIGGQLDGLETLLEGI